MYTLIGHKNTRAFRVLWMLHELGLPHTHDPAQARSEAACAVNPSGKVPVLIADGVAITDSTAIMTFLADRHGALTFPAGSIKRALQDGFTQLILDEFDALLWTAARHSFILPQDMRLPAIKDSLRTEFSTNAERLSARLEGPFLMGDVMTVPDIILGECLRWSIGARFNPLPDALTTYWDRLRARPARLAAEAA